MFTKLKGFYRSLGFFSVSTQRNMCEDLIWNAKSLADWFNDALTQNSSFDNREQPFLNQASIDNRPKINPEDTNENRVIARLKGRDAVGVDQDSEKYSFRYIERQIPPFRRKGANDPYSGAGGIDYIARTGLTPILGEVKLKGDKNAFYAFVQLLVYLSEMATANQISRANGCKLFGKDIGCSPSFDLHILLAERNPKSEKEKLVEPTRLLATAFRRELLSRHPDSAQVFGRIFCLEMNTSQFDLSPDSGLNCLWLV